MYFTLGSSRVTLSPNRFLNPPSPQYHTVGPDLEKAIVHDLRNSKAAISTADGDYKKWTVREVDDAEDPDVMLLSSWKKALVPLLSLTTPLPMIFALWYTLAQSRIFWRHSEYLWSKDRTMYIGLPFMALDLFLTPIMTLPAILVSLKTLMARHRPRLQLSGDSVPAVDILVTCCNEAIDVIQDTLLAVFSVDYPQNKFRVIVADDGSSRELEAWVGQLGMPNLHYTSRSIKGGFKAGNLNHTVAYVETLPGGSSDFIAALDADMIVEKRWLRSIVAQIVLDDNLGLVCPSQHFYNVPVNDPLAQANIISWHGLERLRDFADFAWCTGSGYIMRREALLDIGGFPTSGLTEDLHTSINMMAKGWKTAYVPEALQHGLIPDNYYAHLKQFVRWSIGGCQLGLSFGFYLDGSKTGRLTKAQRAMGLFYATGTMVIPVLTTINQICTPIRFALGNPLAIFFDTNELCLLLRLQCAVVISRWLHELHFAVFVGYRAAVKDPSFSMWMSPYYTISIIRSFFLPSWLGGTKPGFTPTGSIHNALHERSAQNRGQFHRRLHHGLFECGMWFHLSSIVVVGLIMTYRTQAILQQYQHGWDMASITEMLRQVAWPAPGWLQPMLANMVPLAYIMFPPNVPDRNSLLGVREKSGARYPLKEYKKERSRLRTVDYPLLYTLLVGYSMVVLLWSYTI
ncbi:nucleotide-diphospho-sugar transferase [Phaeosphaeria sp. MPI-PUGE-AT-0046c]|nr:nucleotide-diphospho-sugar transferase [Phaeosphaeria sp. MPI-PUGE-AT-0046c]